MFGRHIFMNIRAPLQLSKLPPIICSSLAAAKTDQSGFGTVNV